MGKIKPLSQLAGDVRLFDLIRVFGDTHQATGYFLTIQIFPERCFNPENPIRIDLCLELRKFKEKEYLSFGTRTVELVQCKEYEILKRTDPAKETWLDLYKKVV
jgi:hypothetical protein